MKVLGIHFGHDAGVALIEDGHIKFLAHAERLVRHKKISGISYSALSSALDRANLKPEQIDFCAITSTQATDLVFDDRMPFQVEVARHPSDDIPSTLQAITRDKQTTERGLREILYPTSFSPEGIERHKKFIASTAQQLAIPEEHLSIVPYLNRGLLERNTPLGMKRTLRALHKDLPTSTDAFTTRRFDFNYPATLILDGCRIPAAMISHHAAHAAATFYQSPYGESPIMTLDGGYGFFEGGLFWYGDKNSIVPLRPHYLELGNLYLVIAHHVLKLGGSAEGKMMGLAPYGEAVFFDQRFIANTYDDISEDTLAQSWQRHIADQIVQSSNYVLNNLAKPDKMTTPINVDIAASTQKLFEETMLVAVEQLSKILSVLDISSDNLCLSGGCMLNCPANTRISQETFFRNVYVEPACDDGGLPAGSALWVYHNLMGHPRTPVDPVKAGVPYLGLPITSKHLDDALSKYESEVTISRPANISEEGAKRLAAGQVLGWFEGRSEIGPRALGHRSIVADPRSKETWERVNTIKGRELWRPLAPSVLAEYSTEWFSGMPENSPFMMFVGTVAKPNVDAIRHVDGTARVQTVSAECGGYYKLIQNFHKLTGCAVVLNTSMNGPGEPIAEYPSDAIAMLLDGRFDALILEDMVIERPNS